MNATAPQEAGLELVPGASLTAKHRRWVERMGAFAAGFLEEKLLREGRFASKEGYRRAFVEFKKFVAVTVLFDGAVGMLSEDVDAVWHEFILFTPHYHEFCEEFVGRYLHHVPNMDGGGEDDSIRFVEGYKALFGDLPEIWGAMPSCGKPQGGKPPPPTPGCCKPPPLPMPGPKCGPR